MVKRQDLLSTPELEGDWSVGSYHPTVIDKHGDDQPGPEQFGIYDNSGDWAVKSPYGQPGDRLWVREAWAHDAPDLETARTRHEDVMGGGVTYGPYYRATEGEPDTLRWRPSIHMPRWASRIILEVTGVRVERLQAISEADALAEGIEKSHIDIAKRQRWKIYDFTDGPDGYAEVRYCGPTHTLSPLRSYESLWLNINGPGSWNANPWVWVIEFKRVKP